MGLKMPFKEAKERGESNGRQATRRKMREGSNMGYY